MRLACDRGLLPAPARGSLPSDRPMRVTTKIWLGLGAVVLGYLATLCASIYMTARQEARLAAAASTTLPASKATQQALAALRLQGRAYQDAVLFGEPALLQAAGTNAREVGMAMATLSTLPGLEETERLALDGLRQRHLRYSAAATRAYAPLAGGQEGDPAEAQRLSGEFSGLLRDLDAAAEGFGTALRREQEAGVAATAAQRQAQITLFAIVITASVLLMVVTTVSWSRRLNALVGVSERIAAGRYDAAIDDRRDDEIGRLAGALSRMVDAIQERDRQLREFNQGLQRQVDERTADLVAANARLEQTNRDLDRERAALAGNVAELKRTRDELVEAQRQEAEAHRRATDAARQAGMAEVAIGVLHNVGNVLNSVNVSAGLVGERLVAMRVGGVRQAAQLLAQEPLSGLLAGDERGRQLSAYLAKLGAALEESAEAARGELAGLEKNIDHIRGIIAVQQAYARGAGMIEPTDLAEVVRDALRINATGIDRHGIRIEEQLAPLPRLSLDKHKVMQVVVNLIANAKDAVGGRQREERRIVVRTARHGERVRIEVEDNGMGIAPEHLPRLFQHGFTTKRDGHGFGLHSGCLAAREMGGELRATSDGPDRGARFILELPWRPASDGRADAGRPST